MRRALAIVQMILLASVGELSGADDPGETITVATYNIENFERNFEARRLRKEVATTRPADAELQEIIFEEQKQNDEDNWEVAQTITDRRFSPDVLVIQEGCSQENLDYFMKRWLRGAYETALVFPGNSERGQWLGMILRTGFKVIKKRDQYYLEKDNVGNERGDRLFARGPAFVLIESPSGYRFWAGVTHQKSKSDNNAEITAWRFREAARTHEIMRELQKEGPPDVVLLGDMNDELGVQEFEREAGGDVIEQLVGPKKDGFVLATRELAESGESSFGGYWNPKFRSFIDHIVITPDLKDQVQAIRVFRGNLARVASDHFPVYIRFKADLRPRQ